MSKELKSNERDVGSAANRESEQRLLCLDHARDLIASTERVLANDSGFPNIAYHLAILALEEIGKAGMLAARSVGKHGLDANWIDKRLDKHVDKIMWAVWSPNLLGGKIDPKAFTEARSFAESTHDRRMAGLYVDYASAGVSISPREAVQLEHATSILNLAKTCLELEAARRQPADNESTEELEWFLSTVNDEFGKKRLFSQSFINKHEEFRGDTRAWVRWAREEFARIATQEKEHLQRELARQASEPGQGNPKWLMKIRVKTPSHSLRQKTLNYWNEQVNAVKLRAVGNKSHDLILEITINDHIKAEELFDFGMAFSKIHLAMLNIGTAGFFWYDLSNQSEAYYESITDLESPNMNVVTGRRSGLSREWSESVPGGGRRERVALEEVHIDHAIRGLAVFGPWSDREAEPIFGSYLHGLTLLSKADIHLSVETMARDAFLKGLRSAMHRFGDLEQIDGALLPALHRAMSPIIPEEAHRNELFGTLDTGGAASISEALAAKRAADLYLTLMARKLWPEFVRRVTGGEQKRI